MEIETRPREQVPGRPPPRDGEIGTREQGTEPPVARSIFPARTCRRPAGAHAGRPGRGLRNSASGPTPAGFASSRTPHCPRIQGGVMAPLTLRLRYHLNLDPPPPRPRCPRPRARAHAAVRDSLNIHVTTGPAVAFRWAVSPGSSLLRPPWPRHVLRGRSASSMRLWLNK